MTKATAITIGTSWGSWRPLNSRAMGRWRRALARKMKKTARNIAVGTGTVEAFFERSLDRARKLDRGVKLPTEMRLTFEDPTDLLRVLTAERIRVLHAVRKRPAPVSDLAIVLNRDRTAVRRDVKILISFGLVSTFEETNPGNGRRKIVQPLASKCELVTTI